MSPARAGVASFTALLLLAGCTREDIPRGRETPAPGSRPAVVRTSGLDPGPAAPGVALTNPLPASERVTRDGERLFGWMNCAGCHGMKGGGGIGPPLRDADWIYGGSDAQIYMSILQGRPNGMPSYGGRITDEMAWQIVAYVRSLGGGAGGGGTQSPTEAEGGS